MGHEPCHIIPVPKHIRLEPSEQRWPVRFAVSCESTVASEFSSAFEASVGDGTEPIALRLFDVPGKAGGYKITFERNRVTVAAADRSGFHHARHTLTQAGAEGTWPIGEIEDWPALPVRGFHLNFASYRRLGIEDAIRLVRMAAHYKLNTILVEYGSRFPFDSHPQLRDGTTLSVDAIKRLVAEAERESVRLVPLQQSLAHLEYALAHEHLAHLRERPQKQNLMCPNDPGSLELFKSLASEILASHPKSEWFHIGADEARKVGACDRCAAIGKEKGLAHLVGTHVARAAEWILTHGRRPIVWDDTFCALPEAMAFLPAETLIMYWDYIAVADPTPVLIPRMSHAEGGPRVAHDWRWTLQKTRGHLSDVQRMAMKHYSHPARLKTGLGRRYLDEFGAYLGSGFPKWIKALPYLEYYQDRGFDVITSPTGMGNGDMTDGVPNFERFEHNIRTHAARCKSNGKARGLITTAWYNMPPDLLVQPLIRTAQCAW